MIALLWAAKNRGSLNSPMGRRIAGGARLLGFGTVLAIAGALAATRAAKAQVGEAALQIGREIDAVSKNAQDTTSLRINGQELNVTISSVPESVTQVLDGFQGACEADAEFKSDKWKNSDGKVVDFKGIAPQR